MFGSKVVYLTSHVQIVR